MNTSPAPPNKPSTVLFGLISGNRGVLPILLPTNYAPTSAKTVLNKITISTKNLFIPMNSENINKCVRP